MEQDPAGEAVSHSAVQEILWILLNPQVRYVFITACSESVVYRSPLEELKDKGKVVPVV
jgi:hypothetical protein